jgi:hypothetical protein
VPNTGGIELFYDFELRVTTRDGRLVLEGDWGDPPPDSTLQWPPFRSFGDRVSARYVLSPAQ